MAVMADLAAIVGMISGMVRRHRIDLTNEKQAQAQIEGLLTDHGLTFTREMRLSPGDIPDFFLPDPGLALEVKLRAPSKTGVFRQLQRYAKDERVKGVLLISNTAMGLPATIEGKPAWFVSLGQAWL